MKGGVSVLILVCFLVPVSLSQRCGASKTCFCDDLQQDIDYHLACPSLLNRTIDVEVKRGQSVVNIICDSRRTSEEVFNQIESLHLYDVSKVTMQECPLPPDSLQKSFTKMNRLQSLKIHYGEFEFHKSGNLSISELTFSYLQNLNLENLNFTSLKVLNIVYTENLTIGSNPFKNLLKLERLKIIKSNFVIEPHIFDDLFQLKYLNLMYNNLTSVPEGAFDKLVNLSQLLLLNNQLKTLPSNIFRQNRKLDLINLNYNCLEDLPEGLFSNQMFQSFRLKNYDYCSSKLYLPNNLFNNSFIREVQIQRFSIGHLPGSLLDGCNNIKKFVVQSGDIREIPRGLFRTNSNIEHIDFANNSLTSVDHEVFNNLPNLKRLRLHLNSLKEIRREHFVNSTNLILLQLNNNHLENVDNHLLDHLTNLQDLNLSQNKLCDVPLPKILYQESKMKKFIVSNNLVETVDITEILKQFKQITNLDLSRNNIEGYLSVGDIKSLKIGKSSINLANNKIEGLILNGTMETDHDIQIILSGNPLKCDCFATEVKLLNTIPGSKLKISDKDYQCKSNASLSQMSLSELLCPSDLIQKPCVDTCQCLVNTFSQHVNIKCTDTPINEVTTLLTEHYPQYTVGLDLKHFDKNIFNVDLSEHKLLELHLSDSALREFHLPNIPEKLNLIKLNNNNLRGLSSETIYQLESNINKTNLSLLLGNNPFDCSCHNKDLLIFLQTHYSAILDEVSFTCEHIQKKNIRDYESSDICDEYVYIPFIFAIIIGLIVIIVLLIIISYNHQIIIIYVFSKSWGKYFFSEEFVDKDKSHDVFISYAHQDSQYVEDVLLPGLEMPEDDGKHHDKYKCIIHSRDWTPGAAIPDQILESVENSRRTVIILSEDYVSSMWSNMEFRTAHGKAMKENIQRVLIVLVGKMPKLQTMNEDLQNYIKAKSYIDSSDIWFWKKFRYHLSRGPKKSSKSTELKSEVKSTSYWRHTVTQKTNFQWRVLTHK